MSEDVSLILVERIIYGFLIVPYLGGGLYLLFFPLKAHRYISKGDSLWTDWLKCNPELCHSILRFMGMSMVGLAYRLLSSYLQGKAPWNI
jgi:hypothetical protein